MYSDCMNYCKSCRQCAIVTGGGRRLNPPLMPIPVERVFQITGVDIMELPKTKQGNKYAVVFQDYLSKWPFAFATPDQKAITLAKLLMKEVIPVIGIPEALLLDRGINLMSHPMKLLAKSPPICCLGLTVVHQQRQHL